MSALSRHHGYTIRPIPTNWRRAQLQGYTHHVMGHRASMYGRNEAEARYLVACALRFDRQRTRRRSG